MQKICTVLKFKYLTMYLNASTFPQVVIFLFCFMICLFQIQYRTENIMKKHIIVINSDGNLQRMAKEPYRESENRSEDELEE